MARIETLELTVKGGEHIHCVGCENRIHTVLSRLPGVYTVRADHKTQRVELTLDQDRITLEEVREKLDSMGYKTSEVCPGIGP